MKKLFLLVTLIGFLLPLQAQSIRRATIGSTGSSTTVGNLRISSSFGQKSVACSTVYGEGVILRQGYQQPNYRSRPCPFSVAAAWEEIETECGFYYSFEYQGDANIDSVSFEWNFGTAAFPTTSNQANPMQIAYQLGGSKTIILTVSDGECSDTFSFQLDVQTATFGATTNVTQPECFDAATGAISLTTFGGTEPFDYKWSDQVYESDRQNLAAGDYSYTVTSADGCSVEGTVSIINPTTGIMLSSEVTQDDCTTSEYEGAIDLIVSGVSGAVEYVWDTGATTEDIDNLKSGTYNVTVYDTECISEMMFVINSCDDIDIPDVITPNQDGKNDTWVVPSIENYPDNTVSIYNRWGNLVYNTKGYVNEWTGTNNDGKDLVTGAYYYVLELNNADNTVYGGAITIVR